MAFNLACDAGKTTLRIEGADTGITFKDVYDEGAASVAIDGGGTEDVDFFITEYIEDIYYEIIKNIEFGDGTNTLTFDSQNESVYFIDDATFHISANTALSIGDVDSNYGVNGAYWSFSFAGGFDQLPILNHSTAVFSVYSSQVHNRGTELSLGRMYMTAGTMVIKNSILSSTASSSYGLFMMGASLTLTLIDVFITNCRGIYIYGAPTTDSIWCHNCQIGIIKQTDTIARITNLIITGSNSISSNTNTNSILHIVNPSPNLSAANTFIGTDTALTKSIFTVDIEVLDQNGIPIENAEVKHDISESTDGGSTWGSYVNVGTYITDVNGCTGEQDFDWAQWIDIAKTETQYQHRLEITSPGENPLIINNIRPVGRNLPTQFQAGTVGIFFHGSRKRIAF